MHKIPQVFTLITCIIFSITTFAFESQEVERTFTNAEGQTIKVKLIYQKRNDDQFQIIRLVPVDGSNKFFDKACEKLLGPGAKFIDPNAQGVKILVREVSQYNYGCQK